MSDSVTWEQRWTAALLADHRTANSGGYSEGIEATKGANTMAYLRFVVVLLMMAGIGIAAAMGFDQISALYMLIGLVAGYVVFGLIFDAVVRRSEIKLWIRELGKKPADVFTLDHTGLTIKNAHTTSHTVWQGVDRTFDAHSGLGITFVAGNCMIVPDEYLPKGMTRDDLKEKIRRWLVWT